MNFSALAQIYANAVNSGVRTLDSVPTQVRDEVSKLVTTQK